MKTRIKREIEYFDLGVLGNAKVIFSAADVIMGFLCGFGIALATVALNII